MCSGVYNKVLFRNLLSTVSRVLVWRPRGPMFYPHWRFFLWNLFALFRVSLCWQLCEISGKIHKVGVTLIELWCTNDSSVRSNVS